MPTLVRDLFKSLNVPTLVRDLFKTLNVPTLLRGTKLGEMPITLRIHTPYIHLLNVRDKIGGDANYLTDSHSICQSPYGRFFRKTQRLPRGLWPLVGRRRPPLRLDKVITQDLPTIPRDRDCRFLKAILALFRHAHTQEPLVRYVKFKDLNISY